MHFSILGVVWKLNSAFFDVLGAVWETNYAFLLYWNS